MSLLILGILFVIPSVGILTILYNFVGFSVISFSPINDETIFFLIFGAGALIGLVLLLVGLGSVILRSLILSKGYETYGMIREIHTRVFYAERGNCRYPRTYFDADIEVCKMNGKTKIYRKEIAVDTCNYKIGDMIKVLQGFNNIIVLDYEIYGKF